MNLITYTEKVVNIKKKHTGKSFFLFLFFVSLLIGYEVTEAFMTKISEERVVLGDGGFSPDTLVVKKGTKVTWEIQGDNSHWPASNFHPSHNEYPERGGCIGSKLDSCRALIKGESYSFRFDKVGEFGIHDHLYPGLAMSIIVTSEGNQLKERQVTDMDLRAERKKIQELSKKDPVAAWELVKKNFYVENSVKETGAHELVHIIGNALYSKFGVSALKICDEKFAFGCYHGVIEKLLTAKGIGAIKSVEDYCGVQFLPGKDQIFVSCIHGIGHGIITVQSLELKSSLKLCKNIGQRYRFSCYDGVFMEYISAAPNDRFSRKNPWKFCTDLEEEFHSKCASYQKQIFSQKFSMAFNEMVPICQNAPTLILLTNCISGISSYLVIDVNGDVDAILKNCSSLNVENRHNCIVSSGKEIILQKFPDWELNSQNLCHSLTGKEKTDCLNTIALTRESYVRSRVNN